MAHARLDRLDVPRYAHGIPASFYGPTHRIVGRALLYRDIAGRRRPCGGDALPGVVEMVQDWGIVRRGRDSFWRYGLQSGKRGVADHLARAGTGFCGVQALEECKSTF